MRSSARRCGSTGPARVLASRPERRGSGRSERWGRTYRSTYTRVGLLTLLAVLGCREPARGLEDAPDVGPGADPEREQALELLAPEVVLPARARMVALADRLAIRASQPDEHAPDADLQLLAARLRERIWRLDQRRTDAGEALELYRSALERAVGTATGCEADRRRAQLAADLARDGRVLYGELLVAHRRQSAVLESRGDPAAQACLQAIRRALRLVDGARPSGESSERLEREAEVASDRLLALRARSQSEAGLGGSSTGSVQTATAVASAARAIGSGSPPPLVVAPDARRIGDGPVDLLQVQPFSWEHGGRVVITLSAPGAYSVGSLAPEPSAGRGYRLYLDIARARVRGPKEEIASTGLVERIRIGKQRTGVRVVVDLAERASHRVFYLPEPFRIVVDLGTRGLEERAATVGTGPRTVRRVTLDPGHGGDDHGAVGPTGLREKDVTLDIAHRAAPALAHELGIETMLTRDDDGYVFLEERIARANAFHADLFLSLHCNATEDGQANGLQLYVLDPLRESDAVSRRVARRENALLGARGSLDPSLLDEHVAAVAAGLNVKALTDRTNIFAELLRKATLASTAERYSGMKDYGIKTAGFFVLMGAEMPAVLMEMAFISNPEDEARLATADFRQKLADAVVNAVRAYREGR